MTHEPTTFVRFLALCLAGQLLENPQANLSKLGEEWTGGNLLPLYVVWLMSNQSADVVN